MDYMQVSPLGTAVGFAYRIAAVLLAALTYIFIDWSRNSPRPWSALAVWSSTLAILNPNTWIMILMAANIPCYALPWFGRGDSEILSFAYGAMVLALAIVAMVRIARSKGQLRGVPFCIVGLIGGGYFVLYWVWFFFTFITAYRSLAIGVRAYY